jgi:hypothetical protein
MGKLITDAVPDQTRAVEVQKQFNRAVNRPPTDSRYEMQQPQFHVYLFTCGRRDLKTSHALLNQIEIPACKANERYIRFGIPIPEPFPQRVEDVFGTGADPFVYHRGNSGAKRIAQDICDPTNPTLNQDIEDYGKMDAYFAVQSGTNFSKQGVFWSTNLVPEDKEIARAEAKRDRFYRFVINMYDKFQAEDPKAADRLMAAAGFDSKDVRTALEFYQEERPAYKAYKPKMPCPNCGQQVAQGLAYHKDDDGDLCVIDWERTVMSGKRKREDVPPEKRWWPGPGRPPKAQESAEAAE